MTKTTILAAAATVDPVVSTAPVHLADRRRSSKSGPLTGPSARNRRPRGFIPLASTAPADARIAIRVAIASRVIDRLRGVRGGSVRMPIARIAATKNPGNSASPATATQDTVSTDPNSQNPAIPNREKSAAAMTARDFRVLAKSVHSAMARPASVKNSIVPDTGKNSIVVNERRRLTTGRSIRAVRADHSAATLIGQAAITRMRAGFSQSVQRSAAAAPIANATGRNSVPRALRRPKKLANELPRFYRGRGLPRAVKPKSGSRRAASQSTGE